jgi:hypothetical protein
MRAAVYLTGMLCLSGAVGFAQGWPGYLVDAKCFESLERNVSPLDTQTAVDRDVGREIRYCHPTAKTKAFAFVQQSGERFQLDAAGGLKAAEIVRINGKKARDLVNVSGQKNGHTIQVKSISLGR